MPTYLDEQGNEIKASPQTTGKTYLDDNGEPIKNTEIQPVGIGHYLRHALTLGLNHPDAPELIKKAISMSEPLIEAAPQMAGAVVGGTLGAPLGPAGIAGGAALGAAGMGAAQRFLKQQTEGTPAPSFGQATLQTLSDAAGGALQEAAPRAAIKAAEGIAPAIRESAERQMGQVLKPGPRADKYLTKTKIVPGLLDRGEIVTSRKALEAKAGEGIESAGSQLDKAWAALPEDAKVNIQPVFDRLERLKQKYVVKGTNVIANEQGYKNLSAMQEKLLEVADKSDNVSAESLRSLRQIWDSAVNEAGGFSGKDIADKSVLKAQEYASNAIRNELAKAYPDIAKINAEFSFWKNTEKVIKATNERLVGQERPLSEKIIGAATGGGLLGGAIAGGTGHVQAGVEAGTAAIAMKYLIQLVRSPLWKSASAQLKNGIARDLATDRYESALIKMSRVGTLINAQRPVQIEQQ